MARDHARLLVSIWSDDDWKALAPTEQAVYYMLLSSPDLSWCGVVDYVPERFVDLARGFNRRQFTASLATLRERRFVVVDDRTAEILVRSYVRHDGILKQPNVAKAMVKALARTHSTCLREAVVAELVRAKREDPNAKGWRGVESEDEDLFAEICLKASLNPSGNPSENPSGKGEANA